MMFGCIGINAQTSASAYIDNVISSIKESDGITAQFVLQGDYNSGQYLQGTLKMRGKKFCLTTNDMTSWYDGKTMWSYLKSIDDTKMNLGMVKALVDLIGGVIMVNSELHMTIYMVPSTIDLI